jgi:hypothetical protein
MPATPPSSDSGGASLSRLSRMKEIAPRHHAYVSLGLPFAFAMCESRDRFGVP